MREEHNVIIAGGQAGLAGKIFRIGHMGITPQSDIDGVMDALETVLKSVGPVNQS